MTTTPHDVRAFAPDESFALGLDAADPLHGFRRRFAFPPDRNGQPCVYLVGNSLGLQPLAVRDRVTGVLDDWARLGVDAHFAGRTPWFPYHENLRETGAAIVGARPGEVVMMNSLTANLHLLMVSFYRPTRDRHAILVEQPAFPSDGYAVRTQIRFHGFDPRESLVEVAPRPGETTLRTADLVARIEREGSRLALVLLSGVNFLTGQFFDLAAVADAAHRVGALAGFDLAHAAGNVPLSLHDWNADFAAWCTYQYLNGGPGAVAGAFVHERHARDTSLPRFGGWWGNDPATRFRMQLEPEFVPRADADGWQLSNPPVLAMAPLVESFAIFAEAGMARLREKSLRLTGYLEALLDRLPPGTVTVSTPRDPAQRGCQLSLHLHDRPRERQKALHERGIVVDFREPDVIRVAPVPLYTSFHDVWRFVRALAPA